MRRRHSKLTKALDTFAIILMGCVLAFGVFTSGVLNCLWAEPYEPLVMHRLIGREADGKITQWQAADLAEWRERMDKYLVQGLSDDVTATTAKVRSDSF